MTGTEFNSALVLALMLVASAGMYGVCVFRLVFP